MDQKAPLCCCGGASGRPRPGDADVPRPRSRRLGASRRMSRRGCGSVARAAPRGPSVIVKNTFIDFEDSGSRSRAALARTRTEPAQGAAHGEPPLGLRGAPAIVEEGERPPQASGEGGGSVGEPNRPELAVTAQAQPQVDIGKIMAVERPAARPQVLHRSYDVQAACLRLEWVVSARKLTSTDTHPHVSPAFELSFGEHCPSANFKMLIHPLVVNDKKGGGSFKKAGGRGYVEIACEQELPAGVPDVQFRISIGSGERRSVARGPVSHNFAERSVAGLPKKQGLWDFNVAVDRETHTFVVCLELLSSDSPPSSAPPARTDGNL